MRMLLSAGPGRLFWCDWCTATLTDQHGKLFFRNEFYVRLFGWDFTLIKTPWHKRDGYE